MVGVILLSEKGFAMKKLLYCLVGASFVMCMIAQVSARCIHNDTRKHVKKQIKICMTKANYDKPQMQNRMYKNGNCARCGCSASDHK